MVPDIVLCHSSDLGEIQFGIRHVSFPFLIIAWHGDEVLSSEQFRKPFPADL